LKGISSDPLSSHVQFCALSEAETHQLLVEWNERTKAESRGLYVQLLFEQQATGQPDATALCHREQWLSYGERNRQSNVLARQLLDTGGGPETLICLVLDRSFDMVVAILATLKSGAAYVQIDPAYPGERIAFLISDSHCRIVVTNTSIARALDVGD